MKFRKEVQMQFQKAGWHEGRNVKAKFDSIPRFNEYPEFLKAFLYEYGDLEIETLTENAKGILDLKAIPSGFLDSSVLENGANFEVELLTYPIAYYALDNTVLICDEKGYVYMDGDFPCLVSKDFKTGIEKVIMEDYSDTLEWNPETKEWVDEY